MDGKMFEGMFDAVAYVFITLLVLAPFGLWKIVEIVVWLCRHLRVTIQ